MFSTPNFRVMHSTAENANSLARKRGTSSVSRKPFTDRSVNEKPSEKTAEKLKQQNVVFVKPDVAPKKMEVEDDLYYFGSSSKEVKDTCKDIMTVAERETYWDMNYLRQPVKTPPPKAAVYDLDPGCFEILREPTFGLCDDPILMDALDISLPEMDISLPEMDI